MALGTAAQKAEFLPGMITGTHRSLRATEPNHGATRPGSRRGDERDGGDWLINGTKRFNSGLHSANWDMVFARTSGKPGDAGGITCFLVPSDAPGFRVEFMWWTFNMPSDHAEVSLDRVRVPASAVLGEVGRGLALANTFTHENRIRQAARAWVPGSTASTRACATPGNARLRRAVKNQAIQFAR